MPVLLVWVGVELEPRDVARAEDKVEDYREDLEEMEQECEEAVQELKDAMDPMTEKLETILAFSSSTPASRSTTRTAA